MSISTEIILELLNTDKYIPSIFVSDNAQQVIDPCLLNELIQTIDETHEIITLTSALPGFESNATAVEQSRQNGNATIFSLIKGVTSLTDTLFLKLFERMIKTQKTGNCYEFAIYTHILLKHANIQSEVFRIRGNSTSDSHVFLMVKSTNETFVVDPYLKKIYLASEMGNFLQSCQFRESSNTVVYVSYDPEVHQLDNHVIAEFIEDWHQVKKYQDCKPSTAEHSTSISSRTH
ncbi:transglutaminase-like domain-containing protein [Legionella hackeliae]|uniref:Transglutaminase-like domain-containing protein n=1 Tax=Legionella hackeliae TaxID=449 RepID=A0A0A8URG7_LEGHA|nr:transglutaminase-like domain-containing protein [Legionella hackeliae]KTD10581.1 hypothetical protein Lhac_2949 [Legionella hackeliae]CEK10086.1 protein of unknown function [Legionella hackeliae]STX46810.1 Uncharacterised protein [Legionella hackeliae]